jgi:hypothetical protein
VVLRTRIPQFDLDGLIDGRTARPIETQEFQQARLPFAGQGVVFAVSHDRTLARKYARSAIPESRLNRAAAKIPKRRACKRSFKAPISAVQSRS